MVGPEISVVIAALNSASTIDAQLGALASQQGAPRWELIVVDNGSTDGTRERVERWLPLLPDARLLVADTRRGAAHARNVGIRAARAPRWAVCDADDVVCATWISAMHAALDRDRLVTGPTEQESLNRSLRSIRRPTKKLSDGPAGSDRFLPYALGCNLGGTRVIFDHLGGFDESFTASGEDVDFSWRAQLSGFELAFVPEAVVAYRHRDGLRRGWRQYHDHARQRATLHHRFREHGLRPQPWSAQLRSWAWLITRAPITLLPGQMQLRRRWLRVSARLTGAIRGSLEPRRRTTDG